MVKVISVKFRNGCKPYYFAPGKDTYEKGMGVVVETAKGLEYATVVQPECEVEDSEIVTPLKPVVRIATARDEEQVKRNLERRGEAMKTAQEKIKARGLEMKLVDCEFAFDGSKVVFSFTSESRVDFRELIKDLSSAFHMRIELRQISIRDEIKITGGLAPCGRECCCINCMSEPKKVSVKMAKNQGLSLNPSKISGLCGRLMCCLSYENEYYSEACKKVPKLGGEVETPNGKGTVVNVNMLKMQVKVKIEQNDAVSYHDFGVDEIRFMRGNVVMGNENLGEEQESVPAESGESVEPRPETEKQEKQEKRGEQRRERGNNESRREGRRNDRRENQRENQSRGEKRENDGRRENNNNNNNNNNNKNKNRDNRQRGENRGNNRSENGGVNGQKNEQSNEARADRQKGGQNNFKNKKRHSHSKNGNKPVPSGEGGSTQG